MHLPWRAWLHVGPVAALGCVQQLFLRRSRCLYEDRRDCSGEGHCRRGRPDANFARAAAIGRDLRYVAGSTERCRRSGRRSRAHARRPPPDVRGRSCAPGAGCRGRPGSSVPGAAGSAGSASSVSPSPAQWQPPADAGLKSPRWRHAICRCHDELRNFHRCRFRM